MEEDRKLKESAWPCASFIGLIKTIMHREGVTCTQLAERIGKTPAYVYQILNKPGNHNLNTMIDMAWGLGHRVHLSIYPYQESTVPTPLSGLADLLLKDTVIEDEEQALSFLMNAINKVPSVTDARLNKTGKTPIIEVEILEQIGDPTVSHDYHVFSLVAYISNLLNKNIGIRISKKASVGEEDE